MLSTFDLALIDLQDLGCRIYTFVTTLLYVLEAAAREGKSVWVLDRPNPVGRPIEGLTLRDVADLRPALLDREARDLDRPGVRSEQAEAFLAKYLGGRYEPIGDEFKGASIHVPTGASEVPGLAEALSKDRQQMPKKEENKEASRQPRAAEAK